MSRQAVPSEAGRPLLGTVLRVATSRSQRRGRPLSGRPLSGTSPEVCVCRGVLDGQVCRHSVFVQAGGLIAVRQRLAPVSKARSQDLKESRDFFLGGVTPVSIGVCFSGQMPLRPTLLVTWASCYIGQCYLGQASVLEHFTSHGQFCEGQILVGQGSGGCVTEAIFFKPHFIMIIVFFFF